MPALSQSGSAHSNRYSWYVLDVLFLVYTSNHIDRQILMILLEPISSVSDSGQSSSAGSTTCLLPIAEDKKTSSPRAAKG